MPYDLRAQLKRGCEIIVMAETCYRHLKHRCGTQTNVEDNEVQCKFCQVKLAYCRSTITMQLIGKQSIYQKTAQTACLFFPNKNLD